MATYIIGDIQGCFEGLQRLLEKIQYDPRRDRLGFVGDLVNRGPQSLETLRFIRSLNSPIIVLGNHELHLLALAYKVIPQDERDDTLIPLLNAPDKWELLNWLRQQPFLYHDRSLNFVVVHAGIPVQWSLEFAKQEAKHLEAELQSEDPREFLLATYTVDRVAWDASATSKARWRYSANAFSRMRFCTREGTLDFKDKSASTVQPDLEPWFSWYPEQIEADIIYGHWAALKNIAPHPQIHAIDTGYVWGGALSAFHVEEKRLISVEKN